MIKDDTLWKGILENVFDDFLRFFFDDADVLNENKNIEFVKTLLLLNQFNVGQIANLVKVPEAFVLEIKNSLK